MARGSWHVRQPDKNEHWSCFLDVKIVIWLSCEEERDSQNRPVCQLDESKQTGMNCQSDLAIMTWGGGEMASTIIVHYNNSFSPQGALLAYLYFPSHARQQRFLRASRVKTDVVAPGRGEGLLPEASRPSPRTVSRESAGGYLTSCLDSVTTQAIREGMHAGVRQARASSFFGSKRPTAASIT